MASVKLTGDLDKWVWNVGYGALAAISKQQRWGIVDREKPSFAPKADPAMSPNTGFFAVQCVHPNALHLAAKPEKYCRKGQTIGRIVYRFDEIASRWVSPLAK